MSQSGVPPLNVTAEISVRFSRKNDCTDDPHLLYVHKTTKPTQSCFVYFSGTLSGEGFDEVTHGPKSEHTHMPNHQYFVLWAYLLAAAANAAAATCFHTKGPWNPACLGLGTKRLCESILLPKLPKHWPMGHKYVDFCAHK